MKFEKWCFAAQADIALQTLQDAEYPYLVSAVLAGRGIQSAEEAAQALRQDETLPYSPLLLHDMDRATRRICQAVDGGEKIAVFGDYDVDGITSTCILVDYLSLRGADCVYYIPRRIEDGYGLNRDAILTLAQSGVKLIVTVDCGITGMEEVDYAGTLGVDMVITDHHECREILPDAVAVVNPHREDCSYPFPHLAGCGVALKLVLALAGEDGAQAAFARYSPLAAIGTVADVMPMVGENRIIVSRGLAEIAQCDWTGLHALLKETGLDDKSPSSVQIGFMLSPRINAAGRMGQAELAAELLLTHDSAEAAALAKKLCDLNRERQAVEQSIFAEALSEIEQLPPQQRHALVLWSDTWHQGVVGIVASRLSEQFSCPCFMIHLTDGVGKGSCRSWGGFNLYAALEQCADLLMDFGGHELAAGFTICEENIPAFRDKMNACVVEFFQGQAPVSSLNIDAVITRSSAVTLEEVENLSLLEPYGSGNARPIFALCGATIEGMQNVGQNKHMKLRLSKGGTHLDGIFFSTSVQACGVTPGARVDAAFYLQINEFRGNRSVQMQVLDLRGAHSASAKEEDALALCRLCMEEKPLRRGQAVQLLPTREQCAAAWRFLLREVPPEGLCVCTYPFLRRLAEAMPGADAFLRGVMCLHLFSERGLLTGTAADDVLHLKLDRDARGILLEECPYIRYLYKILGIENRGGLL
jgi:single-stranded-DNA-specific exonuclease